MIGNLLSAVKLFPASIGIKMLEKFNPNFKKYFASAAAYGLDVNRALDYVVDNFGNKSQDEFQKNLQRGSARADEKIAMQDIERSQAPMQALRSAASFGVGALIAPRDQTQQTQQPQQTQPGPVPFDVFIRKHPELAKGIENRMAKGMSPREAAASAKKNPRFLEEVEKIESIMGQSLEDLVENLMGEPTGYKSGKKAPGMADIVSGAINKAFGKG